MPAATATLLEDSSVNIDDWLAGEVDQVFAEQEGIAFVTGDGVNKPKGFLAATTVANASWAWGNIGYIASGVAGAFPASNPSDVLVDLIYALRAGYRQNATFVMNRKTQSTVRKFKDSTGNYLWQPPAAAGGKSSLIGFPLADAEDMPDIAAGSLSIAFGDFRRGYLIVDRTGHAGAARSVFGKTLRAVLHHQARRRRRAGLRRDQALEVRGELRTRNITCVIAGLDPARSITSRKSCLRSRDGSRGSCPAHDASIPCLIRQRMKPAVRGPRITASACRPPVSLSGADAVPICWRRNTAVPTAASCPGSGSCGSVERNVVAGTDVRA